MNEQIELEKQQYQEAVRKTSPSVELPSAKVLPHQRTVHPIGNISWNAAIGSGDWLGNLIEPFPLFLTPLQQPISSRNASQSTQELFSLTI